jgi:hypothetical protein
MAEAKVWVFFYGSYINFAVLREVAPPDPAPGVSPRRLLH